MSRVLRGIAVGLWLAVSVHAQPPLLINYQGRILSGTNLLQGAVELQLRLFAAASGGPVLYEDTGTVTVVDGVYGTLLGDGTASGDLLTALSQPAVYLEMVVNGTTLAPRERLASVPYALKALEALPQVEQDPRWSGASNLYYLRTEADVQFATGTPVYAESDPIFGASVAAGITSTHTARWETAYGWGDHAGAGYLTSFAEADPLWAGASNAYYTAAQVDAAFATGAPVYVESDPAFSSSVAADITGAETARWEAAYGWGDHAGAGYLTGFAEADPLWAGASNAYYTAAQVDAAFATGAPVYVESDPAFSASVAAGITSAETSRWETAYGWGDHGSVGYLTGFTELDPLWSLASNSYYTAAQADEVFATGTPVYVESDPMFGASVAAGITGVETLRWDTAYGWGDHGAAGYLSSYTETDPLWTGASNSYYTSGQVDARFATGMPVYVESDPVFGASVAAGITSTDTTRWETAYGWGDHGGAGYLTSFTEVDPLWSSASNNYYSAAQADALFATGLPVYVESDPAFAASVAMGITSAQTGRWETAYGWGDHATAGYLASFSETDPLWSAASNAYYTAAQADAVFATGTPVYAESDPMFGASAAAGITSAQTSRWETAYGWGDHAGAGYLTGFTETDPRWAGASNLYYQRTEADALFATGAPLYVESDAVFTAAVAAGITSLHTTRWETAYGWGDHGAAGYLTGFSEGDPHWAAASNAYYTAAQADARFSTGTPLYVESDALYAASVAAQITAAQTGRWETAFGWGDHAAAGYTTGAASSNSFVRQAGDTMAGALILPAGGLVVGTTQLVVLANGNVGIGTATPTNHLAVNGSIKAREVIVTANNWPDYVFDPAYRLVPLRDVQAFIAENGHLPGVPSARQIEQEGVPLGDLGATLLRKIEELTLHQIALEQENERLRRDLDALRSPARSVAP
jgi:hypothetical protein